MFALFARYCLRYVARHFHAVRISRTGLVPTLPRRPLVVILNHSSWWDPLVGMVVCQQMPAWRVHYAPIEESGLAQYRILERLGFFGIDSATPAGAIRFLRVGLAILDRPEAAIWITAQGKFVDVRDRPVILKEGVGHLAHRSSRIDFLPMAMEYPFWHDRCPEALVRFGRVIAVEDGRDRSPTQWTELLSRELEDTQQSLSQEARRQDPLEFQTLLGGSAGVGGIYDAWRRLRSAVRGIAFQPDHAVAAKMPGEQDAEFRSLSPSTPSHRNC